MNTHDNSLALRPLPAVFGVLIRSPFLYLAARLVLAGFFLVAGAIKFADLEAFAAVIGAFGLLPGPLVDWAALLLPVAEVLAALALAGDIRGGLSAITALTLLFIAVLGYGLVLGLDIDCGCYGPSDPEAGAFSSMRTSLYRDVGFLVLAGYCLLWRVANQHPPRGLRGAVRRLRSAITP